MTLVSLPGLKATIEEISQRYNLPDSAVEEALREALVKGYEKFRRSKNRNEEFSEEYFENFNVQLDTEDEGFQILTTKVIVDVSKDQIEDRDHQIALSEVQEQVDDSEIQVGDSVLVDVTPEQKDFGRMAAIQTKQVLLQKLRDQQRKLIQEEFQDLEDTVLQARVVRFERQSAIVAVTSGLGQPEVEAELPKREQLPNDTYRSNTTFKVYLKKVRDTPNRGPQLMVSRAAAGLVVELFSNEVPEIEEEIVRIVAIAREAHPPSRHVGVRTKIAVDTLERDVDPVGACIGARGSRIQAVVNELRGEKIDVIRWSPDPATYIANSLSPARVDRVVLANTEEKQSVVLVAEDQLSLAIGKEGQNVRLAARLTGWKIDIKDIEKFDEEAEMAKWAAQAEAAKARTAELAAAQAELEAAELEAFEAAGVEAAATEAAVSPEVTEEISETETAAPADLPADAEITANVDSAETDAADEADEEESVDAGANSAEENLENSDEEM